MMYWALGSVTGRDDTSPPESFGDTVFTVLMMIIGVLWFAYIVASLEQFADSTSNANSILQAKLKYVTEFMHAFHLPVELQGRVKSYYSYLFSSTVKYENDAFLLKLPSALQTDLRVAFATTVIDKADLFAGTEAGFLCYIVHFLHINVTIPSERICSLGEHADRLFFIQDGEVEVLIGPKLAQIATLRAGDHFGEYGMLNDSKLRTSTARSTTYCTLLYLRYEDLQQAMTLFPTSRQVVLNKIAEQRKRTLQQELNLTGLDGAGGNKSSKLKKLIQVEQTDLKQSSGHITIDPNGRLYRLWFIAIAGFTLYNAILLPLRIGFMPDEQSPAILFFDYLGDVIFALDIAINFRLRYMEKGTEIRDVDAIKRRYLSTWFGLHVVVSLPLDLVMVYTGMQPLLRMNKWLRLVDLHTRLLAKMKDSNHWELLSLSYLLFNFLVISHFAASIYFSYTRFEEFGQSFDDWHPPIELSDAQASMVYQYFYAQYYAMTLLAGIGRHNYPPTDYDVLLSMTLMLIGVFVISYLIGKVGHLIFQLDAAASEYKNEYNYVQSMMEYRKVDGAITQRVNEYLRHIWTSQHGIDPNLALNGLPSQLKSEIMMFICEDMIRSVPRFQSLDDSFIRALVSELTFVELPPGEWIFRQGQLGDSMYFISTGFADIIYEVQTEVGSRVSVAHAGVTENLKLKVIGAGSFFGEGALLRDHGSRATPTRSASVRAASKCQLLSLSKASFERVMASHPRFARKIRQLHEDRRTKLMELVAAKVQGMGGGEPQTPTNAPGWTGGTVTSPGSQNREEGRHSEAQASQLQELVKDSIQPFHGRASTSSTSSPVARAVRRPGGSMVVPLHSQPSLVIAVEAEPLSPAPPSPTSTRSDVSLTTATVDSHITQLRGIPRGSILDVMRVSEEDEEEEEDEGGGRLPGTVESETEGDEVTPLSLAPPMPRPTTASNAPIVLGMSPRARPPGPPGSPAVSAVEVEEEGDAGAEGAGRGKAREADRHQLDDGSSLIY